MSSRSQFTSKFITALGAIVPLVGTILSFRDSPDIPSVVRSYIQHPASILALTYGSAYAAVSDQKISALITVMVAVLLVEMQYYVEEEKKAQETS